jgi:hypothetical protein
MMLPQTIEVTLRCQYMLSCVARNASLYCSDVTKYYTSTDLASTVMAECTENTALAASDADIFIPSLLIRPTLLLLVVLTPALRENDDAICYI